MGRYANEESSIGKRLGRLIQQYDLRISYAKGKAGLYAEEQDNASARANSKKTMKATVAQRCWKVYADNLISKRAELIGAIQNALIGYNDRQRKVWFAYFIENKSSYEIATDTIALNPRLIQRMIAAMKSDMELKFEQTMPDTGERESLKWGAVDLAHYLTEKPDESYVAAIKDMLDYGAVDLDALEFDQVFQDYIGEGYKDEEEGETNG